MVCSEYWLNCVLILVLYSTVYHCISIQPILPKQVENQKNQTEPKNNTVPSPKISENIAQLFAGSNNKSAEKVPICSQNETSTLVPPSTSEQSDNNFPQKVFPKTEENVTIKALAELLTKFPSNISVALDEIKPRPVNKNISQSVALNPAKNVLDSSDSTNLAENINETNTEIVTPVNKALETNTTNGNSDQTDGEAPDLLNFTVPLPTEQSLESVPNVIYNDSQKLNKETELIDDGQNTEDIIRNPSLNKEESTAIPAPGVPLVQGQLAAILAGVFVTISVIAYIGLLTWRRYLENRYGTRQMLINEDEFNDDMRHFTI